MSLLFVANLFTVGSLCADEKTKSFIKGEWSLNLNRTHDDADYDMKVKSNKQVVIDVTPSSKKLMSLISQEPLFNYQQKKIILGSLLKMDQAKKFLSMRVSTWLLWRVKCLGSIKKMKKKKNTTINQASRQIKYSRALCSRVYEL